MVSRNWRELIDSTGGRTFPQLPRRCPTLRGKAHTSSWPRLRGPCVYRAHSLPPTGCHSWRMRSMPSSKRLGDGCWTFWPGSFAKALASVPIGSLICNAGARGPAPAAVGPVPSTTSAPLRTRQWKQRPNNPRSLIMTQLWSF